MRTTTLLFLKGGHRTNARTAQRLFVTRSILEKHLRPAYDKFGVTSREDLTDRPPKR